MSRPLVSIIAPMYNAERYVKSMVDSVLSQTYENFELIIVDDCSTDNSFDVAKTFEQADKRVTVLKNEKNTGPGPAKNKGLEAAKGEYITFIDLDDWVENDALEVMVKSINNSDVVVAGYHQDFLNDNYELDYSVLVLPTISDDKELSSEVFAELDKDKVFSFCWQKLYSTKIIRDNSIRFPARMHSEDFFFNVDYFSHVNRASILDKAFYHYIKPKENTLTTNDYIPGFYELIFERYLASKRLCDKLSGDNKTAKAICSTVHVKHLVSAISYYHSKKSGLNVLSKRKVIKRILNDENNIEAIDNCISSTKSERLLNLVMRSKNVTLIQVFTYLVFWLKNNGQVIFDRLKVS